MELHWEESASAACAAGLFIEVHFQLRARGKSKRLHNQAPWPSEIILHCDIYPAREPTFCENLCFIALLYLPTHFFLFLLTSHLLDPSILYHLRCLDLMFQGLQRNIKQCKKLIKNPMYLNIYVPIVSFYSIVFSGE